MPKLHELLAVNASLKSQADKTRGDLMATFKNKAHHFSEKLVSYKADEEGSQTVVESQLDLQTSVPQELKWIAPFIVKSLDAQYQIAEANTQARASVVLENGASLLTDLPATCLLELEKRAQELHGFVAAIPTLDPAKGFTPDTQRGKGIYKAREEHKVRTKKVTKVLTMAPATDKHPAQVQPYTEDVPVGILTTIEWSGLLTVAQKGDMLDRCEQFMRAVKQARSRANDLTVSTTEQKIGQKIAEFIFGQ
jgi:hypothetical protein